MSKNIVVDLRSRDWNSVYTAIERLRADRKIENVYATFIVSDSFLNQVTKLVRDYDLEDACEVHSRVLG